MNVIICPDFTSSPMTKRRFSRRVAERRRSQLSSEFDELLKTLNLASPDGSPKASSVALRLSMEDASSRRQKKLEQKHTTGDMEQSDTKTSVKAGSSDEGDATCTSATSAPFNKASSSTNHSWKSEVKKGRGGIKHTAGSDDGDEDDEDCDEAGDNWIEKDKKRLEADVERQEGKMHTEGIASRSQSEEFIREGGSGGTSTPRGTQRQASAGSLSLSSSCKVVRMRRNSDGSTPTMSPEKAEQLLSGSSSLLEASINRSNDNNTR